MKKCEIKTKCPDLEVSAKNNTSFFIPVFSKSFIAMSSEFTFGDNSDEFVLSDVFMNLVDHDLTEYQITQTLTLS